MRNFVILIGGPGLFTYCDRQHDQTWSNYFVPIQLIAEKDMYHRAKDEKIHWLVYHPPYSNRWADDKDINPVEKTQDDGRYLHTLRKKATEKVLKTGAKSYLFRIYNEALKYGATYVGLQTPDDFWKSLATFEKGSISRVWYFGHACQDGLMLALMHDSLCIPKAYKKDMVETNELHLRDKLSDRFDHNTKQVSKFYGCYTKIFAQEWHRVFKVHAEGASAKIDFGCIDRKSPYRDIPTRLENTGAPGWTKF